MKKKKFGPIILVIAPTAIPTGSVPASRPATEEAWLSALPASDANAPGALQLKTSANVTYFAGSRLLQASGAAFPAALLPPSGEVYTFLDTDTNVVSTVTSARVVSPIVNGSYEVKGGIDCSANPNYPAASKGDAYRVTAAGKIGGGAGIDVQVGDVIVAYADSAAGDQATVGANWVIEQGNLFPATNAQAIAGTNTTNYVVPSSLAAAMQDSLSNLAVQSNADANNIVAATTPVTAAVVTGRRISLRKTAVVNTGAMTLNIGPGAVNIVKLAKDGTEVALVADDMPPGDFELIYNTAGGNRWILQNPMISDIDTTGNASTATLATSATNQKPQYATYGGSAIGKNPNTFQSDTTPGSANNPATAGGAGAFSVAVGTLVGSVQQVITAQVAGATAANPRIAINLAFDPATGTISGTAIEWTGAVWQAVADGVRVQVHFYGVQL